MAGTYETTRSTRRWETNILHGRINPGLFPLRHFPARFPLACNTEYTYMYLAYLELSRETSRYRRNEREQRQACKCPEGKRPEGICSGGMSYTDGAAAVWKSWHQVPQQTKTPSNWLRLDWLRRLCMLINQCPTGRFGEWIASYWDVKTNLYVIHAPAAAMCCNNTARRLHQ